MSFARPWLLAVLGLWLAPPLQAAPPRPQPRPAPSRRPTSEEAFCSEMADRYERCMTGTRGQDAKRKQKLVDECLKRPSTRRALEMCAQHRDCDHFLDCLNENL